MSRIILIRRAVLGLDVVVLNYLLDFGGRVLEVGLGAQSLGYDGDVVVKSGCVELILYSPDIYLFLIYHDHHLYNIK